MLHLCQPGECLLHCKTKGSSHHEERIIFDGSPGTLIDYILVQIADVESKFPSAISESGEITVEGRVKDGVPHLTKGWSVPGTCELGRKPDPLQTG
jgi:hypothetical protein